MFIVKRDGTQVPFDKDKIIRAINGAMLEVDGKVYEYDTAKDIANDIEQDIIEIYNTTHRITSVEDIQSDYWIDILVKYCVALTKIVLALLSIFFSPVDRPLSFCLKLKFLTMSATSKMSPDFIFSTLSLYLLFHFIDISVLSCSKTLITFPAVSLSIIFRTPISSAFAVGTITFTSPGILII